MQPLPGVGTEMKGMVLSIRGTGKTQQSINSEQFWTKKLEDVAPDEVFFHKYFSQRATGTKDQKKNKKEDSENEEEEIWSAMVGSHPELEADGEDVDMDDLDLGNMSDSEGEEGSDTEGSGDEEGEDESEGVEEGNMSLDTAIAVSQHKTKGATASENDDDDDDAVVGLDEEGSDIWASDDDIGVPLVDMDLGDSFAAELETNNSAAELPVPKKTDKKKGRKASAPEENEQGDDDDGMKKKKRKLKQLPTFASADDYAHLLSD